MSTPWWFSLEASLLQVIAVAFGGPLLLGVMSKVRARAEGRAGPPILQPLRDLRKLFSKEALRPESTSVIFAGAPLVILGATTLAVVISPLLATHPILGASADALVVVYLLLTGSVTLALVGLDSAGAFGGMGSSRASTVGALAEPALLVAVVALAIQAGTSNLPDIVTSTITHSAWSASPTRLLALVALLIVVVAETGRLPVDNPATHLELTMIHEAMILEYAGRDLALVTLALAMRLGLLISLVAILFAPWGIDTSTAQIGLVFAVGALALKAIVLVVAVSLVEVHTAKVRLFRVPELMAGGFVLALLAVISELATR